MNTYIITCTGDRPEALKLCNHYMQRQSNQNFKWIVVDDGIHHERPPRSDLYIQPPPREEGEITLVRNLEMALRYLRPHVGTQPALVLIVEDDDWYSGAYVALMQNYAENLAPETLVFGEACTRYYNVRWRTYRHNDNERHASLCATCFRVEFIPELLEILDKCDPQKPYIDHAIFWDNPDKAHLFPTDLVCGIKGMPGRKGIGAGHAQKWKRLKRDPHLSTLESWIGEDADRYKDFYFHDEVKDEPIRPDQRHEPWAIQERKGQNEGVSGVAGYFRHPGRIPDLGPFAAGAFAHGYLNDFRDITEARSANFPEFDMVAISGGKNRHGGLNGEVFKHYRALGVPVLMFDPGRIAPNTQRVSINEEAWLPPEDCSRDRLELLGLEYAPKTLGEKVLIAGQRPDLDNQLRLALASIKTVSKREIVFRPHPHMHKPDMMPEYNIPYDTFSESGRTINPESVKSLEEDLDDAWCVVTHSSTVGITALMRGIPVISSDDFIGSMLTLNLGFAFMVEELERPDWDAMQRFLRRLSYAVWFEHELRSGQAMSYLKQFIKKDTI